MVDEPVMGEPGLITGRKVRNGRDPVVLRDGHAPHAGEPTVQLREQLPLAGRQAAGLLP